MVDLDFAVEGAEPARHTATPTLLLKSPSAMFLFQRGGELACQGDSQWSAPPGCDAILAHR
jgi:hypothetical protein